MHSDWAAEHLLTIRTLMERSAIYRRALAPIVLALGGLGVLAAVVGCFLGVQTPRSFVGYWSGVGLAGLSAAYLMARRQALKDAESFWSAPTRRVTQALLPPLFVGFVASTVAAVAGNQLAKAVWLILPIWMVLYGCALHAAGFFMPRGIKLFGWGFILAGCGLAGFIAVCRRLPEQGTAHLVMGASFGAFHVAYGVYLYFTEKRKNEP